MKAKVLIVDDDTSMCELLADGLVQHGYEARWNANPHEALAQLAEHAFDVVLTDINMRDMNGLELCQKATEAHPELPVIVITAFGSMETAVQAIRAGAYDFITKPFDIDVVAIAIERAVKHSVLTREVQRLQRAVDESRRFDELLGASPAMKEVYDLLERVGESESTVLVSGESGTGKELVARALHENSSRRDKPFIKVNCAAIPKDLMESELFGHERGAFTGAVGSKPGRFELASGGTLFLDEIGSIPVEMQVKLLRALQESEFERVGGVKTIRVDVRLVAATNSDLKREIAAGAFREDLYYRLNVVPIRLPALRERAQDIPLLTLHFIQKFNARLKKSVDGIEPQALTVLAGYPWPGNIRELENVIERAVLFSDQIQIRTEDLPGEIRGMSGPPSSTPSPPATLSAAQLSDGLKEQVKAAMSRLERELIVRALDQTHGNVTHAARLLKISRKGLQLKMKELNLRERDDAKEL